MTASPPPGLDLLAGAVWSCASLPAGTATTPPELAAQSPTWLPAAVPGTAAQALAAAGLTRPGEDDQELLDGRDWWFRTTVPGPTDHGDWVLELGGLATLCDVWFDGRHLLRSESMFASHRLPGLRPSAGSEVLLRFASLDAALTARHPRPRWKSRLVRHQSIRWYRTTLLGRMPAWSPWAAPVGPWRPVALRRDPPVRVVDRWLQTRCVGDGGEVRVRLELAAATTPKDVRLRVGDTVQVLAVAVDGTATGTAQLDRVERWWPHTHGPQPRYSVSVEVDGTVLPLGAVGFRELTVDRADGGFRFVVNGVPIFARGVLWNAPDAVSLNAPADEVRSALRWARDLGLNMLRVPGFTTYQDEAFWDACDSLGILVWQDAMIASVDPPQTSEFVEVMERELEAVLTPLQGRPSLALVCGSSESHQQGSMLGLRPAELANVLLDGAIPAAVERLVPGLPYLPSTPSGEDLPFGPDDGVCHYFGVGAYLRPLHDARSAGVRFAAECLSFATPPERETVAEHVPAALAGHDPRWKRTVARDGGASWDFEDVRDHYVRELFGVDPLRVRYADPELALDYGRAAVAEAVGSVLADWRRTESRCDGALILTWRDAWPGAGWGLVDAAGRAKAPLHVLPRVLASTAVFFSDDGLAGLRLHIAHDGGSPLSTRLRLRLFSALGVETDQVDHELEVGPRTVVRLSVQRLLGGFRDLTQAYRFVPSGCDVVHAELSGEAGDVLGEAFFLPEGPARPRLPDVGLCAQASGGTDGRWQLTVSTSAFAQWVAIHAPGFRPSDSWFHLPPGGSRTVVLQGPTDRPPHGSVRALNSIRDAQVEWSP